MLQAASRYSSSPAWRILTQGASCEACDAFGNTAGDYARDLESLRAPADMKTHANLSQWSDFPEGRNQKGCEVCIALLGGQH
jgi:hypothetical protein